MKKTPILSILKNERGISAIIVGGFILFVGIGIAAFVIDFGYRHVAQNQLHNAADAGALAGARALYYEDGTGVNHDGNDPTGQWTLSANKIAYDAAVGNNSAGTSVEVNWTSNTNGPEVQRGHWSFATHTFIADNATAAIDLGLYSENELDADHDSAGNQIHFINAVKVITRRQSTPVSTIFGKIFGQQSFTLSAEAVAYRGFAGKLAPGEVDIPIAVCAQSICDDANGNGVCDPGEPLDCSYGRMLNSGMSNNDHNTAGWTNFMEDCTTANKPSMLPILQGCNGNPDPIHLGETVGTTGGVDQAVLTHPVDADLIDCWKGASYDLDGDGVRETLLDADGDGMPEYPWEVKVPVIDCPANNVGPCSKVLGAMSVTVIWILVKENDIDNDAPYQMYNAATDTMWSNSSVVGADRWDEFVNIFNLRMVDGQLATVANGGFKKKSVYFLLECQWTEPTGGTGGHNFGVLAKIPVLVE